MSASEKLKALDAAFRPAAAANFGEEFDQHYARQKAQDSLRLALPQIVVLVEAAERDLIDGVTTDDGLFIRPEASVDMLRTALAALEEALS